MLAADVRPFYLLRRDDVGFLELAIGVGAFDELGRDLNGSILIGDLDELAALGIEDLAGLRRCNPLALQRRRTVCLFQELAGYLATLKSG